MKKYIAALFGALCLSAAAHAEMITETFDGGSFDSANWVVNGTTGSVAENGFSGGGGRSVLASLDDWVGTVADPLTISADLTFYGNDIAFLVFRSNGQSMPAYYNEPSDSIYLRMHNFANGQTDLAYGGTADLASGTPQEVVQSQYGNSFYNGTVRVQVVDDGEHIDVTLTNLLYNQVRTISLDTTNQFGSLVGFSSQTARFDNIEVNGGSAASDVSSGGPLLLGMLGLGLLILRRR